MSFIVAAISVIAACELFLATSFLRLARELAEQGTNALATIRSAGLTDDQKERALLQSSGAIARTSVVMLGLILLYAAPIALAGLIWPGSLDVLLNPWWSLVLAVAALIYVCGRTVLRK